ncbi:MAG: cytochrome c biogenesis protein [Alicyclobacillus sp.]|nr:cytochrome c biogenesis protein [Alicyclobacillus sp.]
MARALYDALGIFYGTSLVLFFIDVVQPRRVVNRAALLCLFAVFVLETAFLMHRLQSLGHIPMYSPYDATLLLSWLIVLIALCINAFFRLDVVLFMLNVIGFGLIVLDTFARPQAGIAERRVGDLLVLHISAALLSYVAFTFSFVFSTAYLIQHQLLRRKKWTGWFFRLPPLKKLDVYAFRAILVGFPLLLVAMVLGASYERLTLHRFLLWDLKPIVTFALWIAYGIYLVLRLRSGWGGVKLTAYSAGCFALVLANLWVVGRFSLFHHGN